MIKIALNGPYQRGDGDVFYLLKFKAKSVKDKNKLDQLLEDAYSSDRSKTTSHFLLSVGNIGIVKSVGIVIDVKRSKNIEELNLSVRSHNALKKLGIRTAKDVTKFTEKELLTGLNFGRRSLAELKRALSKLGLSLKPLG